jgi:oxygen-dependent protoporphyrinogen oxidase
MMAELARDEPPLRVDVAIVGAGISGLAAAYELHLRGLSFRVLEKQPRPGGVIVTERFDGFLVDAGPDSLLVQKPAAPELCRELGISDRLVATEPPRTAFVYRGGALHAIPEASILGFPTRFWPLVTSSLFSWSAKLRMARELFSRPRQPEADESIASFVQRHFGREAVDYIAEPLLAGIHAGDVDHLSIRASFPRLVEAEATHGSIIRAFATRPSKNRSDGVFRSLPGGLGELVDAVISRLPEGSLRCGGLVQRIEPAALTRVYQAEYGVIEARAIVLALPAWATASLVQPFDEDLARMCCGIPYWSTATVFLAYPVAAVAHPLHGTGFVVPRREGLTITAGTWVSSKWPKRAPEGQVLLRAFLGGARDPQAIERSDAELVAAAERDLGAILHIRARPSLARVYRWHRASPQQEVGHVARMAEIDRRLTQWPSLFITGTGLRGVGIPDCIADGRATARAVAMELRRTEDGRRNVRGNFAF